MASNCVWPAAGQGVLRKKVIRIVCTTPVRCVIDRWPHDAPRNIPESATTCPGTARGPVSCETGQVGCPGTALEPDPNEFVKSWRPPHCRFHRPLEGGGDRTRDHRIASASTTPSTNARRDSIDENFWECVRALPVRFCRIAVRQPWPTVASRIPTAAR